MLKDFPVYAALPVVDLERAKKFYSEVLGLETEETMKGMVTVMAAKDTKFALYQRGPTKADHTVISFLVTGIEDVVKELKEKGVAFEHYDMPEMGGIKTNEMGIAEIGGVKAAWFKDTEGNIIGVSQM